MTATDAAPTSDRELVLTRLIDAPRAKLFKAWTDPDLLKRWFAPLPWTTPRAELDVRPGGANLVVMRGPDRNEFPNRGVATGTSTVTQVPSPGCERTATRWPSKSDSRRTIDNPRPSPVPRRESRRRNSSKAASIWSAGMPIPVSLTSMTSD